MISFCSYIKPHFIYRYLLNLHPWPIAKQFEFDLHLVNLQSYFDILKRPKDSGDKLKIKSITKAIMNH